VVDQPKINGMQLVRFWKSGHVAFVEIPKRIVADVDPSFLKKIMIFVYFRPVFGLSFFKPWKSFSGSTLRLG
jgi:hypothetical protein